MTNLLSLSCTQNLMYCNSEVPAQKSKKMQRSPFNLFFCDSHYETEKHKLNKLMGLGFMNPGALSLATSKPRVTFVFLVGLLFRHEMLF